jgi:hypothetical protein
MSDTVIDGSPLDSEDLLDSYCDRVRQQLEVSVENRARFLEKAHFSLTTLLTIARKTADSALVAELTGLAVDAARELDALRGTNLAATLAEMAASIPLAAVSAEPGERPPVNGSAAALPDTRSEYRTVAVRPALPPRPMAPPVPPTPRRSLEEVYQDTDSLVEQAEAEGDVFSGTTGLIKLKALMCRQRALQAELAQRDIQHWPLRSLLNYLRRRIDDEHGPGHYLIPLRAEIHPSEAWPWYRLADLYEALAEAHISLDWYENEADKLTQPERQELLESIAAHQTRLWRHLQIYFPRQNDEHQIHFFRDLCAIAEEEDVYLYSLQERCPDDLLNERAEQLPVILEHLQLDKKNRAKREAAVMALRALVTNPDFGTRESDPADLEKAIAHCRKQGAPASSVALRSLLTPWASLLEESTEKAVQEVSREIQRESERLARRAEAETPESDQSLTDEEQAELDEVQRLVRGKRCLFIGGICREESRQRLERELGLAELVWPSTNGMESVYKFEPQIEKTDVTVIMVRFMRTGWGQARELAVKHNKMFVRLPAGYGLRQVVRQFHRQLPREEPVTAGK